MERNLPHFALRPDTGRDRLQGHKALAELIILCDLLHRALGPEGAARVAPWVAFARRQLADAGADEHLARNPHLLLPYATMEAGLRGCGAELPDLRRVVQQVVDTGHGTAHERLPYRTMDLAYILERGGYRHPFPPLEALYPATLLATCPSPLWLKTSEAYQATHTLFYLGDFGLDPARLAAHPDAPRLRSFVAHLLGVHVRQRDWDLVAELLLDCRCLGHAPEPLASLAWQALHDAWEAHGLVPGPSFDPALRGTLGPAEWERYCFDENYHTVLVTLLACAVWSRPVPPIAPGPARTPPTLDEDRIRSALAAAAGWLSAQAGAPGLAADDRAHAALGLASAVAAGADPAAEAALRSLLPALTFEALLGCDPLAVALLNPLLAAASVPAPAVAQAAAVVLEVCRQAPGPPGARQFLLAAAGLLEIPQAPMAWSQPLSSLFAGRDTVLLAAARLQALGPRSAAALAASPLAQAVLESALHEAFMRYDLEAGLALLLPLGQAAPRGEAVAVALDFLLAQQHPAGYVGFQDAGTGPGAAALRVQQKVRTTAWAAWTLRGLLHPAKRPA